MTEENKLNRHNDPAGLLQSLRGALGGRPYLGDAEVIDKILNVDLKDEMLVFLPLRHNKATYGSTRLKAVFSPGTENSGLAAAKRSIKEYGAEVLAKKK